MSTSVEGQKGAKGEDHWSSEAYQNAAAFVPKLATKVVGWLDVRDGDRILDVGCGDGVLNIQIAQALCKESGTGRIHGVDSSVAMITAAKEATAAIPRISGICTFEALDATLLHTDPELQKESFDKVFSNAAMHWILRPENRRDDFFKGVHKALKPGGIFVFEMGGMGNCAEMRTALLSTLSHRIGIRLARAADPWFFPSTTWMRRTLTSSPGGFEVLQLESEYRPTKAGEGGIRAWVILMGKQFFDVVEKEKGKEVREECEKEVEEVLRTVVRGDGGDGEEGEWIGYVRLRGVARKL
ncbi:Uncharacterized protein BP5553_08612 [Venustampulla echinocandica]|uniref:Methyltransferase domain-containing protein n=1 Tax=Venustampulla echinocandica TaxID=2656787 RepID=A0A370TER0_9HELO|nr:Uncharacterized protein BP5553_08612 [Venustampulla echinocandica]RDL33173.1 Uncharacterized protein BP5553_08612 [Venustampulla echinocandica]